MTDHHRRPKSRGGKKTPENISVVPRYKHQAYHLLFDSFSVPAMCQKFDFYYEVFGDNQPRTYAEHCLLEGWIYAERSRDMYGRLRRFTAWGCLFGGMEVNAIVAELNKVWIDPAFRIEIYSHRLTDVPGRQFQFKPVKVEVFLKRQKK